jgi:hypothetical protein
LFPGKYERKFLEKFDDDGVVRPGETVNAGDPLVLLARERQHHYGQVGRSSKNAFADQSVVWDHHSPGVVTDVVRNRRGVNVVVKSIFEMQEGDKLSNKFGGKSVVRILPDDQMPHDQEGKPFEMAWSPLSLLSRINPAWVIEAALGKVAAKTGVPYKLDDFNTSRNLVQFALDELKKNGLSDTETIIDPATGRRIPNVLTGVNFIMKLHHSSESKAQGRGLGAYSAEGSPLKTGGNVGSALRMSLGDTNALLSHGATSVLRDSRETRGQKNDEFWLAYMGGFPAPHGKVPFVYQKFLDELKASGVNIVRDGPRLHLMALTDKDVKQLAGDRELKNAETVRFDKNLEPIKGGLFDPTLSGGHGGNQWSRLVLTEPLPNPAFEDPARHLLGLTEQQFLDVLSGKGELKGKRGPRAIQDALGAIDVPRELEKARAEIASGRKSYRDAAVRRLGYLKSLERTGLHPKDWILSAVPVIPPVFRPVSLMAGNRGQLISDPNLLYKELHDANQSLAQLKGTVDDVSEERLNLYKAFKGVVGLGEPTHPKNLERGVKGLLREVFGSSPKYSYLQQRLLGTTVDLTGRGVIVPNPDLDMDHVGIPETKAWDVYRPFVVRRLVRSGYPRTQALREVEERSKAAREMLVKEMNERPVLVNRYPLLHKYGLMAFMPKLVAGDTIHMSPLVTKGLGADFDGDTSSFHLPVSPDAVRDAVEKMLPSRNLLSAATMKATTYLPNMEFQQGLYSASATKDDRPAKIFRTRAEALAAYRRGDIGLGQKVEILEDR